MNLVEILSIAADRLGAASTSLAIRDNSKCRERLASLSHFLEEKLSALPPEEAGAEQQPEEEKEEPAKEETRPSPKAEHLAGEGGRNQ